MWKRWDFSYITKGAYLVCSFCNIGWLRTESNRRHKDFQSFALPTELLSHKTLLKMAVPTGIEPAISCVTGRHVNRYTTGPYCGGRIWTCGLRVMSPTSYRAAPPRDGNKLFNIVMLLVSIFAVPISVSLLKQLLNRYNSQFIQWSNALCSTPRQYYFKDMVEDDGLEPPTLCL